MVDDMLMRSLNPNVFTHEGYSLLLVAARQNNELMVELLLEAGTRTDLVDRSWTCRVALHHAAAEGGIDCLRPLLAARATANLCDLHELTPLFHAVVRLQYPHHTFVDIVRLLLQAAADVNCRCEETPPLARALTDHSCHLVWHLPEARADPNCRTRNDDAALRIAARRNFSVAIAWLLDKRADPAARHGSGQTAYDLATDDVAKRLLH